ncbi:hypothetical protein QP794_01725 [Paenibacillus sp. UMB7766-LJ446]|uniref:hypothetical protein n=1 Tax=Paenibacillus sp. UMB7766-LJ446 TaxID=3046313 RepID=UPI00254A5026|nr:hypothetical protein [Paenibacillus sp. UMB7766-LJ446]MDK8188801.1 hypothetical protein [Paenibacillus sp. UMB7766-LJ446]
MDNFKIISEVVTKPTGTDGVRNSKWSDWSSITSPGDYIIDTSSLKVKWISDAGSENKYEVRYKDYIRIPNSLTSHPKTVLFRCFARGPRGFSSGRGWSKIELTGKFKKLISIN